MSPQIAVLLVLVLGCLVPLGIEIIIPSTVVGSTLLVRRVRILLYFMHISPREKGSASIHKIPRLLLSKSLSRPGRRDPYQYTRSLAVGPKKVTQHDHRHNLRYNLRYTVGWLVEDRRIFFNA